MIGMPALVRMSEYDLRPPLEENTREALGQRAEIMSGLLVHKSEIDHVSRIGAARAERFGKLAAAGEGVLLAIRMAARGAVRDDDQQRRVEVGELRAGADGLIIGVGADEGQMLDFGFQILGAAAVRSSIVSRSMHGSAPGLPLPTRPGHIALCSLG